MQYTQRMDKLTQLKLHGNSAGESRRRSVVYVVSIWAYGVSAYLLGVAGLGVLVAALAGLIPLGLFVISESTSIAVTVNIGLVLLFGVQHSVMARPKFKHWFQRFAPESAERASFVLASGLVLAVCVLCWQPVSSGVIWRAGGVSALLLWLGFGFGWLYLLAATFAINHFDLFGLRQLWFDSRSETYRPVVFKESWMYRYSRHPIMFGALVGMWSLPVMTVSSFMLVVGLTLYIAVGVYYEERDLIAQWGASYLEYKKRVRALL